MVLFYVIFILQVFFFFTEIYVMKKQKIELAITPFPWLLISLDTMWNIICLDFDLGQVHCGIVRLVYFNGNLVSSQAF